MSGLPFGTFAGLSVTELSLHIPLVGLWVADVKLASALPVPPIGPLVHGNLTLQGGVYRQSTFAGVTSARIAGGFGGWSRPLTPRGYSQPFGVLMSQIVADAALECGELATVTLDIPVGPFWSRPPPPVSGGTVLRAIAGPSWWVNATGTVIVGPRLPSVIASDWQVIDWDGAAGILDVATEDQASWVPGAIFASPLVTSPQTIASVRHTSLQSGKSRMRVMVSP